MRILAFVLAFSLAASAAEGGLFKMGMKMGQADQICIEQTTYDSVTKELEEVVQIRDSLLEEKKSLEGLLQAEVKARTDEGKAGEHKVQTLESTTASLREKLSEQKEAFEKLKTEHAAGQEKIADLISAKSLLEGESKAHKAMLENMGSNAAPQEIAEWQRKVESLEISSEALREKLAEQKKSFEKLAGEHRASQDQFAELVAAKSLLEGETKTQKAMLERIEDKYDNKMSETEDAKNQYLEAVLSDEVDKAVNEMKEEWFAQLETAQAEKKTAVEALETRLANELKRVESEKEQMLVEFDERTSEIEEKWESSFESLKEEHANSIASAEAAARKALDDLRIKTEVDTKETLDSMRQSYEKQREILQGEIEKLTRFEAMYHEAKQDADYWETRFHRRNYLNLTHIKSDAVETASRASVAAAAKLSQAKVAANNHYAAASDHVQKKRAVIEEAAAPHVNYVAELYYEYVKEHVDNAFAAAKPHYDEHIAPHISNIRVHWSQGVEEYRIKRQGAFDEMVTQFTLVCPDVKGSLKNMPESIQENASRLCAEPEESVSLFLRVCATLFVIIFRRPIWRFSSRMIWLLIATTFSLFWFFCPLRLFVGKTKGKKAKAAKTAGNKEQNVAQ